MKFDKYLPSERLRPYIKYYVVSEEEFAKDYKVFPSSGLVIGFQYKGQLSIIEMNTEHELASSGVTGISNSFRVFRNSSDIGTILVCFTAIGFTHFSSHPANELFDVSISLDYVFRKEEVSELEEKLVLALTDKQRVKLVEQFFLRQLKEIEEDKLVLEAVRMIYRSKGTVGIKELSEELFISQSPLEKRFRKVVGTTPKKFATIVRFNTVLDNLSHTSSLTELCYESNFFDQAHFIKDFKRFTGVTPENFKHSL